VIDLLDKAALLDTAEFRRFLFALIQRAGLFAATATDTDGRHLFHEGRRSLAIEILRDFDEAQAVALPGGIPALTLIQTLREEVQAAPKENSIGRRNDAYSELRDDGDGDVA